MKRFLWVLALWAVACGRPDAPDADPVTGAQVGSTGSADSVLVADTLTPRPTVQEGDSAAALPDSMSVSGPVPDTGTADSAQASRPSQADSASSDRPRFEGIRPNLQGARQGLVGLARKIIATLILLVLVHWFTRLIEWILELLGERSTRNRLLYKRLVPITRVFIWAMAAWFIAAVIFDLTGGDLVAAGAAIGVAIGLAAQDVVKNVFGGLVILFDQPFQVGDKIEIGGTYGEVVSIGLRSTRVVTPDDSLVTLPNARVVDGAVSNANAGQLDLQAVVDLYLPGWIDEGRAKRIAYEAAATSKYVFLNKPIVVLVLDEYRDTFITHLKVKAYVSDIRHEFLLKSDVTERARAEFRRQGLIPPFHGARPWVDMTHGMPDYGPDKPIGGGDA